jgi:outer membrane protein assembly factor BamB
LSATPSEASGVPPAGSRGSADRPAVANRSVTGVCPKAHSDVPPRLRILSHLSHAPTPLSATATASSSRPRDALGQTQARELWRYEKSFVAVVPSPLVLDGLVYTIKNGGILTVLRADTGEVVRTGRVGSAPASYSASPVATGGRIYFANEDGVVAVVRAGRDWEVLAANDLGEPIFATPALSDGRIYVRGQQSLYSFAAR